jgi:hypothetical protein
VLALLVIVANDPEVGECGTVAGEGEHPDRARNASADNEVIHSGKHDIVSERAARKGGREGDW